MFFLNTVYIITSDFAKHGPKHPNTDAHNSRKWTKRQNCTAFSTASHILETAVHVWWQMKSSHDKNNKNTRQNTKQNNKRDNWRTVNWSCVPSARLASSSVQTHDICWSLLTLHSYTSRPSRATVSRLYRCSPRRCERGSNCSKNHNKLHLKGKMFVITITYVTMLPQVSCSLFKNSDASVCNPQLV